MKKFIFIICSLALVACSEEKDNSALSDMPSLESATDFGSMKLEKSPYNFSSMEALRISILAQAKKESLSEEEVSAGIDELASKLITENFETLSLASTEAEAEEAMMKLFMRAMGAKDLKVLLNL